jgi:hypothetical protein
MKKAKNIIALLYSLLILTLASHVFMDMYQCERLVYEKELIFIENIGVAYALILLPLSLIGVPIGFIFGKFYPEQKEVKDMIIINSIGLIVTIVIVLGVLSSADMMICSNQKF